MNRATNYEGKNRARTEKLEIGEGRYQVTFSLGLKLNWEDKCSLQTLSLEYFG